MSKYMDADMPKERKKEKERFHYDMVNNHIHENIMCMKCNEIDLIIYDIDDGWCLILKKYIM